MTAAAAVAALIERRLTIAVAESLTGGLVVADLVSVPGASAVVRGGIVAYASDLKAELLGVDSALLEREGAIHPLVAEQMASGVRAHLGADVGLSTTGVAGPDSQDGHEPGEVWVGISTGTGTRSRGFRLSGDRATIRHQTVDAVFRLLLEQLAE